MMERCDSLDRIPKCTKHMIHLAIEWHGQMQNHPTLTQAQIAAQEGLSRARVTQVMSLLALPSDVQRYLAALRDPKEIRFFSERRLRRLLCLRGLSVQRHVWEETVREFNGSRL
jgi:hypothetical protein